MDAKRFFRGCFMVTALYALPACSDTPEDSVSGPSSVDSVSADGSAKDGNNVDQPDIQVESDVESDTGPVDAGPPPCLYNSDCADGNPCTKDTCDPKTGVCTNVPLLKGDVCDDFDACTTNDVCVQASEGALLKCLGEPKNCDDTNPCTVDSCDKYSGCGQKNVGNNTTCEDGNKCTDGDLCYGGQCLPGMPLKCVQEECLLVKCQADKGCSKSYTDGLCDDGNACTMGDKCAKVDAETAKCEPGTSKECDDGNVCTNDNCDKQFGCEFTNVSDGQKCDDGNGCTESDACKSGKCLGAKAKTCNDDNECTTDSCLVPSGDCDYKKQPFGTTCNDGSKCTNYDGCTLEGKCVGVAKSCDDGLPCTIDECEVVSGTCKNTPHNGACDDTNPCTVDDKCVKADCVGVAKNCNDNNVCTLDECKSASGGCVFAPKDGLACNDGDACSLSDSCVQGQCKGAKYIDCDDSNDCTQDECNKISGCKHTSLKGTPCDDSDACTLSNECNSGTCVPKSWQNCNDNDPCTKDSCDPKTGKCEHLQLACDDNSVCTNDSCNNGKCVYIANSQADNNYSCEDGNSCTQTGFCLKGKCMVEPKSCDDFNICTKDLCDPSVQSPFNNCVHICDPKLKDAGGMPCFCQ